ncbi:MAG: ATP-binding cassette domain-containing protein [Lachnospiraceae bacterium]|nr:ATP-binding cassette domain-containing protein [Lachnospiraceae bacterium]
MCLEVSIKKRIGTFKLEVEFNTDNNHIGILGASGCGKSMTLKCIAGIENPDEGRIVLDGKVLFDSKEKIKQLPQKRKIGYLFQNYALFPNMTVTKNIGITKATDEKITSLISKLHLKGLEDRYPSQLSGGEQQRVALARILAYEPEMIILDEPFSALDGYLKDQLQREMLEILADYKGKVIVVSHSKSEIYRLSEQLIVMDKGKVVLCDDKKKVFNNPQFVQVARLTGYKNISKAKKVDDYCINALDWNITLKTKERISDSIEYVGIMSNRIEALPFVQQEAQKENIMKVDLVEMSQMPFNTNYIVRNISGGMSDIWVKTANQKEIRGIIIPESHLVLLRQ